MLERKNVWVARRASSWAPPPRVFTLRLAVIVDKRQSTGASVTEKRCDGKDGILTFYHGKKVPDESDRVLVRGTCNRVHLLATQFR